MKLYKVLAMFVMVCGVSVVQASQRRQARIMAQYANNQHLKNQQNTSKPKVNAHPRINQPTSKK